MEIGDTVASGPLPSPPLGYMVAGKKWEDGGDMSSETSVLTKATWRHHIEDDNAIQRCPLFNMDLLQNVVCKI
jgi:hypothetical protein